MCARAFVGSEEIKHIRLTSGFAAWGFTIWDDPTMPRMCEHWLPPLAVSWKFLSFRFLWFQSYHPHQPWAAIVCSSLSLRSSPRESSWDSVTLSAGFWGLPFYPSLGVSYLAEEDATPKFMLSVCVEVKSQRPSFLSWTWDRYKRPSQLQSPPCHLPNSNLNRYPSSTSTSTSFEFIISLHVLFLNALPQ